MENTGSNRNENFTFPLFCSRLKNRTDLFQNSRKNEYLDADDDIIPQSRQFCVGIPVICPVFLTESFCFCLIGIRYLDVLSGHVFQRSQRHGGSHVSDSDK